MKKLATFLGLSLFVLSISSFSTIEKPMAMERNLETSIDHCALMEELPEVYSMVDFQSFKVYNQKLKNGEITEVKTYEVKQDGELIGIYGEIQGSEFYTEDRENSFTYHDLTNGTAFTAPKTFNHEANADTPDFEQMTLLKLNGENMDPNPTPKENGKGWCYAFCFTKYVACISAAGVVIYGGATAATAATGGPGAITFTVAGTAQAAAVALCLVNYNSCLAWCDS